MWRDGGGGQGCLLGQAGMPAWVGRDARTGGQGGPTRQGCLWRDAIRRPPRTRGVPG